MKMLRGALLALLIGTAGCAQAGNLGEILGGVMNAPAANQLSGTIQGVDTRSQQIFLKQSNGQTVALTYDNNTQVVYQNQNYPVTALESGDQVTARYQDKGNNGIYVDMIQVTQSTTTSSNTGSSNSLYNLEGNVRSIDRTNGVFTLATQNGTITVSMPYNARSSDVTRFNSLRTGNYVQIQGLYLNESRVELRQFY